MKIPLADIEFCAKCGFALYQCECETPQTQADRIRSMSDEELAKFLEKSYKCKICCYGVDNICYSEEKECIDGILEWLKKEAKE